MVDINEKAFAAAAISKKWNPQAEKLKNRKDAKECKTDPINIVGDSNNITSVKVAKAKKRKAQQIKLKNKKIKKRNVPKPPKEKVNVARLPQSSTDLSSNWKRLLQQMEEQNKNKVVARRKPNNYSRNNSNTKTTHSAVDEQNTISQEKGKMDKKNSPEIWFDNVDECLLDHKADVAKSCESTELLNKYKLGQSSSAKLDPLIKDKSFKGFTKAIAMDCEMVGVGYKGDESVLARVSLVNHFGHCVYDKYVKAREKVTDYRTAVSGIRPEDIENANDFKVVQKEVSDIMNNRILVGHAIRHDLKVKS